MKNIKIEIHESACDKFKLSISKPKLIIDENKSVITAILNTDENAKPFNIKYRIGIAVLDKDGEVLDLIYSNYFYCHFEILHDFIFINKDTMENNVEKILLYPTTGKERSGFAEIEECWCEE